jgi:ankyrin repeat protein
MLHYTIDEPPLNREPTGGSLTTAAPSLGFVAGGAPSHTSSLPDMRRWGPTPSALHHQQQHTHLHARYPQCADEQQLRLLATVHEASVRNDTTTLARACEQFPAVVHARDSAGRTALHWAAKYGGAQAALLLLRAGACPNAQDARGLTPLHYAAQALQPQSVLVLLRASASTGAHTLEQGVTALHVAVAAAAAALAATPSIANVLAAVGEQQQQRKADVDAVQTRRESVRQRVRQVLLLLLRGGASLNGVDHEGDCALHWAVREACAPVVAFLVRAGANPLQCNEDGESALQLALELGEAACVQAMDPQHTLQKCVSEAQLRDALGTACGSSSVGADADACSPTLLSTHSKLAWADDGSSAAALALRLGHQLHVGGGDVAPSTVHHHHHHPDQHAHAHQHAHGTTAVGTTALTATTSTTTTAAGGGSHGVGGGAHGLFF